MECSFATTLVAVRNTTIVVLRMTGDADFAPVSLLSLISKVSYSKRKFF